MVHARGQPQAPPPLSRRRWRERWAASYRLVALPVVSFEVVDGFEGVSWEPG